MDISKTMAVSDYQAKKESVRFVFFERNNAFMQQGGIKLI